MKTLFLAWAIGAIITMILSVVATIYHIRYLFHDEMIEIRRRFDLSVRDILTVDWMTVLSLVMCSLLWPVTVAVAFILTIKTMKE